MIRPAYWTDADLHTRLTAEQREFYIGLWMLADDAGYVAWDIDRVGAELYPYKTPAWRARRLPEWISTLEPHVRTLECGKHVVIPNLTKHQSPPKPSFQVQKAHDACLRLVAPHGTSGGQVAPAQGFSRGREGVGKERVGLGGAPRQSQKTPGEAGSALLQAGLDPAIAGRTA